MGQIKNIKLHIVTDIKEKINSKKWRKSRSRNCVSTSVLEKVVTDLFVLERCWRHLLVKHQSSPKLDTLSDRLEFDVMRKLQSIALFGDPRQRRFWRKAESEGIRVASRQLLSHWQLWLWNC